MRKKQHRVVLDWEDAQFLERLAARLGISIAEQLRRWVLPHLREAQRRGLPEAGEASGTA